MRLLLKAAPIKGGKNYLGADRRGRPHWLAPHAAATVIGDVVRRWCASNASYLVLDRALGGDGGTWNSGGCVALAYGLQPLLPGSEVVGMIQVFRTGQRVIGHVGLLHRGAVIDADGAHSSATDWVQHWNEIEAIDGPAGFLFHGTIGVDDATSRGMPLPSDRAGEAEITASLRGIMAGRSRVNRKELQK